MLLVLSFLVVSLLYVCVPVRLCVLRVRDCMYVYVCVCVCVCVCVHTRMSVLNVSLGLRKYVP